MPVAYAHRYAQLWPQAELTLYPGTDHVWSKLPARQALILASVRQIVRTAKASA